MNTTGQFDQDKCNRCYEDISAGANICPNCNIRQNYWGVIDYYGPSVTIAIAIFMILISLSTCHTSKQQAELAKQQTEIALKKTTDAEEAAKTAKQALTEAQKLKADLGGQLDHLKQINNIQLLAYRTITEADRNVFDTLYGYWSKYKIGSDMYNVAEAEITAVEDHVFRIMDLPN